MRLVKVNCPYCTHGQQMSVNADHLAGRDVVLCDTEEGGCDMYFAAFWTVKVEAEAFAIAGQVREAAE